MERHAFASDNTSGIHPAVLDAITHANNGCLGSYGADDLTKNIEAKLAKLFEHDVRVFLVATGTAANALALAQLVDPWGSILCHETAHIMEDECGAPEMFTGGAKLILLSGENGKISAEKLQHYLNHNQPAAPHNSPLQALSLSNATECGTCYTPQETAALTMIAKKHKLPVHMDGARFANAVVRMNASPAELTWHAGVDVLSFGFTKNGALGVEAVVFFNAEQAENFEYKRKRSGHLLSKHRFFAAQIDAMLIDGLWLKNAKNANDMADYFAEKIGKKPGVQLAYPVQANEVFLHLPKDLAKKLEQSGYHFHRWALNETGPYRFVCSFNTTREQVDQLSSHF